MDRLGGKRVDGGEHLLLHEIDNAGIRLAGRSQGVLRSWACSCYLRRRSPWPIIFVVQLTALLEDLEGRECPDHVILAKGGKPLAVDLGELDVDVLLPQGLCSRLILGSKSLTMPAVAVGLAGDSKGGLGWLRQGGCRLWQLNTVLSGRGDTHHQGWISGSQQVSLLSDKISNWGSGRGHIPRRIPP